MFALSKESYLRNARSFLLLGRGMEAVGEKEVRPRSVLKTKKFPFYVQFLFTSLQDYLFPLLEKNLVLTITLVT